MGGGLTFKEWESNLAKLKEQVQGIPILNQINQVLQHINPHYITLFVPNPNEYIVVAKRAPSTQ
jgi:hypothetical protein